MANDLLHLEPYIDRVPSFLLLTESLNLCKRGVTAGIRKHNIAF